MDRLPITTKFIEGYFTPASLPNYRLSQVQLYMAKLIHDALKKVIAAFPANSLFRDMGLLLTQDIINYEMTGRVIPENSDLLFGAPREVASRELQVRYGKTYSMSVGGISFTTTGTLPPFGLFRELAAMAFKNKLQVGDVTYLEGGALKDPIIVLSNSRYMFYNSQFVNRYNPHTYLTSANGGVTLQRHFVK